MDKEKPDAFSLAECLRDVSEANEKRHPALFKQMMEEVEAEEKEAKELLKKGVLRSRVCDPFNIMRFAKILEKQKG